VRAAVRTHTTLCLQVGKHLQQQQKLILYYNIPIIIISIQYYMPKPNNKNGRVAETI